MLVAVLGGIAVAVAGKPGGTAVFSSSSLCRGANLWFFPFIICFCFTLYVFVSSPLSLCLISFWSVLLPLLSLSSVRPCFLSFSSFSFLLSFSVLFSPQSPLFHSLLYSSLLKFILLSFVLSFPPLFFLFFVLSIFVHFFFSLPLPSPSLPLFFFLFFDSLLHLSPLVFIRRKKEERGPLPLSSHGTRVGGGRAATGQCLIGHQISIFMQLSS